MILHIVSAIFLGILLSGIWFGMNFILCIFASKMKSEMLNRFSVIISAMIPTAIILKNSQLNLFIFSSVGDWKSWLILAVTVLLVSVISSRNKMTILPEGNDWNENISLSVFITAIIWCASICIQCIIMRRKFDTSVMRELLASFVFSMGVGVVLLRTEFIGFSMLAHFAERIISTMLRKISKNVDNIHGYNIFNRM